jgi:hypothetical protein
MSGGSLTLDWTEKNEIYYKYFFLLLHKKHAFSKISGLNNVKK